MKPNSSSISNSELAAAEEAAQLPALEEPKPGPRSGFRLKPSRSNALWALAWTLVWLVGLDVGIGFVARPDPDPRNEPRGAARYFDYGRSVESKLREMVRDTPAASAPVTAAGWLATPTGIPPVPKPEPTRASDSQHILIAMYGQSFTHRIANTVGEVDPGFEARFVGGPAVPLSHSYAVYEDDRGKHEAQVAMIGVLASSFARLASLTNMTLWFEEPQPATYPRYYLRDGQLEAIQPLVRSFDDLRDTLRDPVRWERFVTQLREHDAAYDPLVFDHDLLDYSTIGRAVRRALGQRHARDFAQRYVDEHGFTNRDQILDVAEAIFARFAKSAREDGKLPYVVLFSDYGYGDDLARALGPRLAKQGIPYLSSDAVIDPNDPANFSKDAHFRPDLDRKLAQAWAKDLRQRLAPHTEAHAMLKPDGTESL